MVFLLKAWSRLLGQAKLVKNSSFVLIAAVILGLALPGAAQDASAFINPALMLMMTFSMTSMKFGLNCSPSASRSSSSAAWDSSSSPTR